MQAGTDSDDGGSSRLDDSEFESDEEYSVVQVGVASTRRQAAAASGGRVGVESSPSAGAGLGREIIVGNGPPRRKFQDLGAVERPDW